MPKTLDFMWVSSIFIQSGFTDSGFTDSSGKNRYCTFSVKTKGFLNEMLEMSMEIGKDQIARVNVVNRFMGSGYAVHHEINKLRFYYDLNEIEG